MCSSEHVLLSICGVGTVHLDGKMLLLVLKGVQVKFDQDGDAGFCLLQNYVKPGFLMLQKLIIETITANHAHCNCGGNTLTFVALN